MGLEIKNNGARWNIGDLVQLKSGGPVMTVTDTEYGIIDVAWFVGNKISTSSFKNNALEAAAIPVKSAKTPNRSIAEDAILA